ncbi:hypothetical protein NE237_014472 [Protea cynaroides]|uniref:Uncharacterized protein n=1 Tax=Protea cynaroides TaxID=273540 RepID=A0A9Q0KCE3_9MAGN|nr:hypothetical protein NE237_014472 [Protea cynaroides]
MEKNTSATYLHVAEDLLSKLSDEGFEDSVLTELQVEWEFKMVQREVIDNPIKRNSASRGSGVPTLVQDLKVPYEGTEKYKASTAEPIFPPMPFAVESGRNHCMPGGSAKYGTVSDSGPAPDMMTGRIGRPAYMQPPCPLMTQRPLGVDVTVVKEEAREEDEGGGMCQPQNGTVSDSGPAPDMMTERIGRPAPYMQPPCPWMNQRPLGVDVTVVNEEAKEEDRGRGMSQPQSPIPMKDFSMMTSGKRKREEYPPHVVPDGHIPQQDGAGDVSLDSSQEMVSVPKDSANEVHSQPLHDRFKIQERRNVDSVIASIFKMKQAFASIPQYDGYDDVNDDGFRTEDYSTPSCHVGSPKPVENEALEDEDPPLNEDDNDNDGRGDLGQGDEETADLVLAQFVKVSRTKSIWRCSLKDGFMRLNNKDILFTTANGVFEFGGC